MSSGSLIAGSVSVLRCTSESVQDCCGSKSEGRSRARPGHLRHLLTGGNPEVGDGGLLGSALEVQPATDVIQPLSKPPGAERLENAAHCLHRELDRPECQNRRYERLSVYVDNLESGANKECLEV